MRHHSLLALAAALSAAACAAMPAEEGLDHREHPHHLSLLVGETFETTADEEAVSIGVDYEYRTSEFLGLGAVYEEAFGELDSTTLIAVADLHFGEHFALQIGPGVEFIDSEEEVLVRTGCLYEFEFGRWTLSPQLHYDFTSGEDSIVAGVAFGVAF